MTCYFFYCAIIYSVLSTLGSVKKKEIDYAEALKIYFGSS